MGIGRRRLFATGPPSGREFPFLRPWLDRAPDLPGVRRQGRRRVPAQGRGPWIREGPPFRWRDGRNLRLRGRRMRKPSGQAVRPLPIPRLLSSVPGRWMTVPSRPRFARSGRGREGLGRRGLPSPPMEWRRRPLGERRARTPPCQAPRRSPVFRWPWRVPGRWMTVPSRPRFARSGRGREGSGRLGPSSPSMGRRCRPLGERRAQRSPCQAPMPSLLLGLWWQVSRRPAPVPAPPPFP